MTAELHPKASSSAASASLMLCAPQNLTASSSSAGGVLTEAGLSHACPCHGNVATFGLEAAARPKLAPSPASISRNQATPTTSSTACRGCFKHLQHSASHQPRPSAVLTSSPPACCCQTSPYCTRHHQRQLGRPILQASTESCSSSNPTEISPSQSQVEPHVSTTAGAPPPPSLPFSIKSHRP